MNESDLTAERHPTLYFPNGDIVLSASIDSAPPRTQLFCVHKVLLTHHSTAFANLFADANPGSGESCDGVPMVELHGDKAEDLALLLNYLYNPTQMTFKRFDPKTPLIVSGVIRLADKYCIENLREHLVKVVVSDWPTTLQEWDIFQIEIQAVKDKLAITNAEKDPRRVYIASARSDLDFIRDHIPEPASAIAFAQEFGCYQILPAAFYQLATIAPTRSFHCNVSTSDPCARWDLLSKETLLRYIRGSNTLLPTPDPVSFMSSYCRPPPPAPDEEVAGEVLLRSPCGVFFQHLIAKHWNFSHKADLPRDSLRLLSQCLAYYDSAKARQDVPKMPCQQCEKAFRDRVSELRVSTWALLPMFFRRAEV